MKTWLRFIALTISTVVVPLFMPRPFKPSSTNVSVLLAPFDDIPKS